MNKCIGKTRLRRKKLKIKGIVQGVGFRPFVYRLAHAIGLTGFVRNTTDGVDIEIEGTAKKITRFIISLKKQKPHAARIDTVLKKNVPIRRAKTFVIKESKRARGFTQISPDIATCSDCLEEMNDAHDRRFKFPFINCTNCGPRYSIVIQTPYDRKRTTMKEFKMCPACAEEFSQVADRRFHAQPDCCEVCGPNFSLYSITGKNVVTDDPIIKTAQLIRGGEIVAIKGIGGFHIACDATNRKVVIQLRALKHRPTKPLAIMVRNKDIKKIAYVNSSEQELIQSPGAPIMLLRKKGRVVCEEVAPHNPYLGVMVPYAPIHHILLEQVPYLVMTSGNIQDEPLVTDDETVQTKLRHIVSYYLTHNRKIENRCDDSVGFVLPSKGFSIIRRSRGFVPVPVELPFSVKSTLAVGPYLKNTFTLANKRDAYMSPHIGDLDNLETLHFFNEMIERYQKWFKIEPELIVHDLHPDYLSTKIAHKMSGKRVGVQHHVAHIASCLGENNVFDDAIGVAFDGTGFGLDRKIWGSEFFVGNMRNMKRVAHLEYLPLPGGEVSIKRPYRIAVAYLYKLFGKNAVEQFTEIITKGIIPHQSLRVPTSVLGQSNLNFFHVPSEEVDVIMKVVEIDRNLVYTSSMGRLFDCVAAMLGLVKEITYEAEAAINLEYLAAKNVRGFYQYSIEETDQIIIGVKDIFAAVLRDIKKGIALSVISAKFHNTIARFSLDVAQKLSRIYGMKNVCFSGGVFQNRYLLNLMIDTFQDAGFNVLVHRYLPTNDGCISYGQVIMGNAIASSVGHIRGS
jgi:hydrogenase maturation protein HypF